MRSGVSTGSVGLGETIEELKAEARRVSMKLLDFLKDQENGS